MAIVNMEHFDAFIRSIDPLNFVFGMIAMCGSAARYLAEYKHGIPFKIGLFGASLFVGGFSGWLFAQIALSLGWSLNMVFVAAGSGGIMGERAIDFIIKYITRKLP